MSLLSKVYSPVLQTFDESDETGWRSMDRRERSMWLTEAMDAIGSNSADAQAVAAEHGRRVSDVKDDEWFVDAVAQRLMGRSTNPTTAVVGIHRKGVMGKSGVSILKRRTAKARSDAEADAAARAIRRARATAQSLGAALGDDADAKIKYALREIANAATVAERGKKPDSDTVDEAISLLDLIEADGEDAAALESLRQDAQSLRNPSAVMSLAKAEGDPIKPVAYEAIAAAQAVRRATGNADLIAFANRVIEHAEALLDIDVENMAAEGTEHISAMSGAVAEIGNLDLDDAETSAVESMAAIVESMGIATAPQSGGGEMVQASKAKSPAISASEIDRELGKLSASEVKEVRDSLNVGDDVSLAEKIIDLIPSGRRRTAEDPRTFFTDAMDMIGVELDRAPRVRGPNETPQDRLEQYDRMERLRRRRGGQNYGIPAGLPGSIGPGGRATPTLQELHDDSMQEALRGTPPAYEYDEDGNLIGDGNKGKKKSAWIGQISSKIRGLKKSVEAESPKGRKLFHLKNLTIDKRIDVVKQPAVAGPLADLAALPAEEVAWLSGQESADVLADALGTLEEAAEIEEKSGDAEFAALLTEMVDGAKDDVANFSLNPDAKEDAIPEMSEGQSGFEIDPTSASDGGSEAMYTAGRVVAALRVLRLTRDLSGKQSLGKSLGKIDAAIGIITKMVSPLLGRLVELEGNRRMKSKATKIEQIPTSGKLNMMLDNMDGDGQVNISVQGPGAAKWAKNQQSVLGSMWETDGDDFAYAIVSDEHGLIGSLADEGYVDGQDVAINTDRYTPAEAQVAEKGEAVVKASNADILAALSDLQSAATDPELWRSMTISEIDSVDLAGTAPAEAVEWIRLAKIGLDDATVKLWKVYRLYGPDRGTYLS